MTRRPLERMMRIHEKLAAQKFPNCSQLAGEFEVAAKTIQRDIDFMRDSLRLPIEYDANRYGFYYTEPVANFPTLQISEGELVAVFVAQKALAQYRGTSFERPLRAAFEKLTKSLTDQISFSWNDLDSSISFRPVGASVANLEIYERVSQAVLRRQELEFDYRKLNGSRYERRRVQPYHLACVENQWYLFAFDLARNHMRRFVLSRMRAARPTGKQFELPAGFSAKNLFGENFGVFSEDPPQEIRVKFDRFAAQLVRERSWHPSQQIKELPGDELEIRFRASSFPEIVRWVLSWGDHARVLAPKALRDEVVQTAKKVTAQYR